MGILRMLAVELGAGAVVFLPAGILLNRMLLKSGKKTLLYGILAFYLAAIYVLVGMPNITYVRLELNLNWIPFAGFLKDLRNGLLNVALFVPLGFLLPALWGSYRRGKKTLLTGFGLSAAIELLQILTSRATDVNDLITNTLGTALGFLLARWAAKRIPAMQEPVFRERGGELALVLAAVFAVMFLVQPFLAALFWNWI